jgi:hypothetical protein
VITALLQWGDRWIYGEGREPLLVNRIPRRAFSTTRAARSLSTISRCCRSQGPTNARVPATAQIESAQRVDPTASGINLLHVATLLLTPPFSECELPRSG